MVGFSKFGAEQIGMNRMIFFMIKIYDEDILYQQYVVWNGRIIHTQLNFGCAISGLALQVWNLQLAIISGTDSATSMHI